MIQHLFGILCPFKFKLAWLLLTQYEFSWGLLWQILIQRILWDRSFYLLENTEGQHSNPSGSLLSRVTDWKVIKDMPPSKWLQQNYFSVTTLGAFLDLVFLAVRWICSLLRSHVLRLILFVMCKALEIKNNNPTCFVFESFVYLCYSKGKRHFLYFK